MIFKRISYTIATQFMAFVFVLLLVTGGIFLGIDVANRNNQLHKHLEEMLHPLLEHADEFSGAASSLPPFQRDRIRITDASGASLVSGSLYDNIPFTPGDGITTVNIDDESYDILTNPVFQNKRLIGYIQMGDRSPPNDLLFHLLLYLLISFGISGLTFGVGLFFARRSLAPAEEMVERLEQFTQDASHELRTPITAVSTSLDLAIATNDYPENVRNAKKDLKEVSVLVERLLELARLDTFLLEQERVDLSGLVTDSIEKHRSSVAEKEITIKSEITPGIFVNGDPTLVRQVLANLLGNAVKFNKHGGAIDVKLTADALTIRDTGKGISTEAMPHIFDRFYQEDSSRSKTRQGLGLGLALVKRIVELHGWSVVTSSKQDEGTTFTVRFS